MIKLHDQLENQKVRRQQWLCMSWMVMLCCAACCNHVPEALLMLNRVCETKLLWHLYSASAAQHASSRCSPARGCQAKALHPIVWLLPAFQPSPPLPAASSLPLSPDSDKKLSCSQWGIASTSYTTSSYTTCCSRLLLCPVKLSGKLKGSCWGRRAGAGRGGAVDDAGQGDVGGNAGAAPPRGRSGGAAQLHLAYIDCPQSPLSDCIPA